MLFQLRKVKSAKQKGSVMLKVTVQDLDNVKIFRCTGRMVYGSEDQLITALSRQHSLQVAVFDLAGVRMIDAAGLGSLIAVAKRAKAIGIKFRLMNLHPRVEDLLMLTKLRSVLAVCSVPELVDLLCRAWNQPAKARNRPKRTPLTVLDDAGIFSVQAWF